MNEILYTDLVYTKAETLFNSFIYYFIWDGSFFIETYFSIHVMFQLNKTYHSFFFFFHKFK